MKNNKKTITLIVGMHRSGTSAMGKLLQAGGADFGDNLMEAIQSINDEGFWEDKEFVAFNQHILTALGVSWYHFERLPGKWWEDEKIKSLYGAIESWFKEGFDDSKTLVLKDPRLCRLLPFWKRFFQSIGFNLKIVFVFRNPLAVAQSLQKRDGFTVEAGYLLWLIYNIDALYYSRTEDLCLLGYESLIANQEKTLLELECFLPELSYQKNNQDGLINPDLNHHQANEKTDDDKDHPIKHLAIELYDELSQASAETAKKIADKFRKRLYRLLDHHKELVTALQAGTHQFVELNKKLSEMGGSHSYALDTIGDKDQVLADNARLLKEAAQHAATIEARMTEQDQALGSDAEQLAEAAKHIAVIEARMTEQDQVLADNARQLEEAAQHIATIESRNKSLTRRLQELGSQMMDFESRIIEQDKGLEDNATQLKDAGEYIAKCENRIVEQDQCLAGNAQELTEAASHIANCESRLNEQETLMEERKQAIQILENGITENTAFIAECQVRITELDSDVTHLSTERTEFEQDILSMRKLYELHNQRTVMQKSQINKLKGKLASYEKELQNLIEESERKSAKIEWYRGYTAVKVLDKFFYKKPEAVD